MGRYGELAGVQARGGGRGEVLRARHHVAVTWPSHGRHVPVTWQLRGSYVAVTWQLRGRHMAVAWPLRGRHVAVTWQLQARRGAEGEAAGARRLLRGRSASVLGRWPLTLAAQKAAKRRASSRATRRATRQSPHAPASTADESPPRSRRDRPAPWPPRRWRRGPPASPHEGGGESAAQRRVIGEQLARAREAARLSSRQGGG